MEAFIQKILEAETLLRSHLIQALQSGQTLEHDAVDAHKAVNELLQVLRPNNV